MGRCFLCCKDEKKMIGYLHSLRIFSFNFSDSVLPKFDARTSNFNKVSYFFDLQCGHNILAILHTLPSFPFPTNKTERDYYLKIWYILVASLVAERFKIRELRKNMEISG